MWFHLNGELFWLGTVPYWAILISALLIRKRRGFGVYLSLSAVVLLFFQMLFTGLFINKRPFRSPRHGNREGFTSMG